MYGVVFIISKLCFTWLQTVQFSVSFAFNLFLTSNKAYDLVTGSIQGSIDVDSVQLQQHIAQQQQSNPQQPLQHKIQFIVHLPSRNYLCVFFEVLRFSPQWLTVVFKDGHFSAWDADSFTLVATFLPAKEEEFAPFSCFAVSKVSPFVFHSKSTTKHICGSPIPL